MGSASQRPAPASVEAAHPSPALDPTTPAIDALLAFRRTLVAARARLSVHETLAFSSGLSRTRSGAVKAFFDSLPAKA
jgi:hypothetical protein